MLFGFQIYIIERYVHFLIFKELTFYLKKCFLLLKGSIYQGINQNFS